MGNGGPSAGGFAPTAGRLRCASRRPTMRSMALGERSSPSPEGSETMGTSGAPGRGPSEIFAFAPTVAAFAALPGARACAPARPGRDDVVNPKHHDRRVRRRGDRLAPDADRLDHVLFLHVGDFATEHVDPRSLVPLLVLLAQLDQDVDWVQARVLREGPWDALDGVRERFDGHLFAPADGRREVPKRQGDLHRARTAAGDDLAVLHRDRDAAGRVLEGPLELTDHVLRATAQEDRDRLRVLAPRHERHLIVADLLLVHLLRKAEIVFRQLVELRHDLAAGRLRELFHVRLLDPAHRVDLRLREVVLREVVDALLAEDHGRAALPHDLDHALQHRLFLVEEGLELGRVRNLDLRIDFGLLDLEGCVDEGNLCILHFARHPGVHTFLVDDDAVNECRVRDRTALLLHDLNIVIVDEVRRVGALLDGRRGAVAGFLVLGLRDLDEHLGRGVFDVNLLEDRDAIVRDDDVPEAVHEHLIHSAGAQGRAHRIRNRLRGRDVVELRSLAALAARPFLQDQNRRTCWHHVSSSEYRIRTLRYIGTSI